MLNSDALGRRVVVRYRRPDPLEGPPLSDVVGILLTLDGESVAVAGADGTVVLPLNRITAAKLVPPDRRAVLALEATAARGWCAADTVTEAGWLLRADHGFTGRANSAVQLSTTGEPLDDALERVRAFYSERGLPPQVQLPMPTRAQADAELAARGWTLARPSLVLTRPLSARLLEPGADEPAVRLDTVPSEGWLAGYHYRGGHLPATAVALLRRHPRVRFASVVDGDEVIAIARGTVDDGWLGVTALEVSAERRRTGAGTAVMTALQRWGLAEGAATCYLQVDGENTVAQAFYRRLGFAEHHRYRYRVAPSA